MNAWWTLEWIHQWGVAIFSATFWPLTVLGAYAARTPATATRASNAAARRAVISLGVGLALGLCLLAAALIADTQGQPVHVSGPLFLYGSLFECIHGALLGALVVTRWGQGWDVSRGGVR